MALDRLTKVDGGGISTTSDYRVGIITASKFVGPIEGVVTGSLTGTATTAVNAQGLTGTPDIVVGILTASSANFSGNVSIGGTLTYEDVTNIDSVGVITARNGIKVSTGTATTALVVDGDARVTGILTVGTSSLKLDGPNNLVNVGTALTLGHSQGVQFHTQNLHSQGFEVNQINASGIVTATGLKVGTGATIETSGQAEIAGITTFYKDVHIKSGTNRLYLGTGNQLSLIADPSHSYLRNAGSSSHFQIHSNNFGVRSYTGNGSIMLIYAPVNDGSGTGGPQLWHYNGSGIQIKRLSTTTSGVNIVGTTTSTQLAITGVSTFTGAIDANGDIDVDGHTNLDNVSISGISSTGNIYIV